MKYTLLTLFLMIFHLLTVSAEPAIIPRPLELKLKDGQFNISSATDLRIEPSGCDLERIGRFLSAHLQRYHSIDLNKGKGNGGTIRLRINRKIEGGPEAYRMTTGKGGIVIESEAPNGLFYGVQSLLQMLPPDNASAPSVPYSEIYDKPRFTWRGLHLDVGRHFFPVAYIKRYIDFMAMYKLNRFHWHLTEDQGWRLEIKKHPLLTEISHWRDETITPSTYRHKGVQGPVPEYDGIGYGGFYTQDQVKEIVQYAADRYVTIIPEIEMPGHSCAALAAYPGLGCTGGPYHVQKTWGIFDDVYCAGNEETFQFLEDVLGEVCDLFPSSWIHIGGDECPKTRWKECPLCQARIRNENLRNEEELQSYFIRRVEKFLSSKGKKLVGWEEIQEGGLPENATMMAWKNQGSLGILAASQGYDVVVCPTAYCYLNIYQTRGSGSDPKDYRTDGVEPVAFRGYIPLEKVYSFEPVFPELDPEASDHIIGSQANLWTEFISNTSVLEYMLFPRLCALAEVVWTGKEKRDYQNFRNRLDTEFLRLRRFGINFCDHPD
jgi:hexosaminidase